MPWLNVVDNVAFGLRMRGVAGGGAPPRRAGEAAAGRPRGLRATARSTSSRAACSSASASRARWPPIREVLLMDEPLGALDAFTRESIQELILDVWHRTGKMCFFITHSVEEALFLATHLVVMTPRPGTHLARVRARLRPTVHRHARRARRQVVAGLHPRARGGAGGHPAPGRRSRGVRMSEAGERQRAEARRARRRAIESGRHLSGTIRDAGRRPHERRHGPRRRATRRPARARATLISVVTMVVAVRAVVAREPLPLAAAAVPADAGDRVHASLRVRDGAAHRRARSRRTSAGRCSACSRRSSPPA